MIEGLKIDIRSTDLEKFLSERAEHHDKRLVFCNKEADRLDKAVKEGNVDEFEEGRGTFSNAGTTSITSGGRLPSTSSVRRSSSSWPTT